MSGLQVVHFVWHLPSVVVGPGCCCCLTTVCVVWWRLACSLESIGLGWWMEWASWCSTEVEGRVWRDRPLSTAEEGNPRFPRRRPFCPLCPIVSTSSLMYRCVLLCASGHCRHVFMSVVWAWERVTARHRGGHRGPSTYIKLDSEAPE